MKTIELYEKFMNDPSVHSPAKRALAILSVDRDPIDAMQDANAIARILRRQAIAGLKDAVNRTADRS